jgi:hypothetical protein
LIGPKKFENVKLLADILIDAAGVGARSCISQYLFRRPNSVFGGAAAAPPAQRRHKGDPKNSNNNNTTTSND